MVWLMTKLRDSFTSSPSGNKTSVCWMLQMVSLIFQENVGWASLLIGSATREVYTEITPVFQVMYLVRISETMFCFKVQPFAVVIFLLLGY
jgi:hypothetical protein